MNPKFHQTILNATGAASYYEVKMIQSLWSGYGRIVRMALEGGAYETIVVKHVQLPKGGTHPRGWNTDISHQRKVKSYEVETDWYEQYSNKTNIHCRLPKCIATDRFEDEVMIILEDLDASGFPKRKSSVSWDEVKACLKWLANFHAVFINQDPEGLWPVGTYWHLETRPEELEALEDPKLKSAAGLIDKQLSGCQFQTLVHGDAKLANFCFSNDGQVAAVDFQYVGGGCGMKDVAYFIGSCSSESESEEWESRILEYYFSELRKALRDFGQFASLESEWRSMYHVAWADFHRFLKGWSPGHWKINSYSERISHQVADDLLTSGR